VTLAVALREGALHFQVKVVPGSARERIAGLYGSSLKVAVTAPPEQGKANAAVCALLARTLGLPAAAVQITAGTASPRKTVAVRGLDAAQLLQRLDLAPA
jgi:uncharacterized protein (TIGR00251 family)